MSGLRIRKPFAASFALLVLTSAYLGFSKQRLPQYNYGQYGQSDKVLHFVTFFLLTLTFYWILELPRRRVLHLTLITCTAGLAIGSEIVQALIPNNNRGFDPYDIVANVVGSSLALIICSWYHKRMLERRRKNKHYDIVPGDEPADPVDVELGEGNFSAPHGEQETGTIPAESNGNAQAAAGAAKPTVSEELDNWDENAEDWEEDETTSGEGGKTPGSSTEGGEDMKKRSD